MIKNGSVRKRGNKWYYSFEIGKIDGKRKRIERVCQNATNERQAYKELDKAIELYECGGILENKNEEMTVKDLFQIWSKNYVDSSITPNARKAYNVALRDFEEMYGIYKVKTITRLHAQEFCNMLFNKGLAKKTIELKMSVVKGAFEYAITTLNLFEYNPITKFRIPKDLTEREESKKIYTEEEVFKILQYFKKKRMYYYYISCLMAYKTGMREGEIFGLCP